MTPNDPGDADTGPNQLQNFPVLTCAAGGSTRCPGPEQLRRHDLHAGLLRQRQRRPVRLRRGRPVTSARPTVTTDAAGNVRFQATVGATTPGEVVTATATDPAGNTSEFSAAVLAYKEVRIDVKPGRLGQPGQPELQRAAPVGDDDAGLRPDPADLTNLSRIRFGDVNGTARVSPVRAALEDVEGRGPRLAPVLLRAAAPRVGGPDGRDHAGRTDRLHDGRHAVPRRGRGVRSQRSTGRAGLSTRP